MSALAADRNLLFGLLALQNGLINQIQLVAAFQAWTLDKARALADHLVDRGDLDVDDRSAVDALVARHIKKQGGDVEKSLAVIPAGRSTCESLARLGEADIEASLAHVGAASTQAGDDIDRTASYSVGSATSDGQRFRVLRPHARGGLGAVFVALDAELHREVALKQLLDHHADDPVSRQRFLLEAEVTGGLEHPGIVPVYGLGTYSNGRPYYAMRFIRGDSLKEANERFHADESLKKDSGRRSLELRKLLRRFTDVCNAIDYAHSRGVLHRDIKPGNIIVGKYGETLVVDRGLAKSLGRVERGSDAGERTFTPSSASGSAETLPGSALGTPAYMSPEQAAGDLDRLGPRSDVYSLGATLYCLLTGKPPQEGDDVGELLRRVQRGDFPRLRQVDPSIDPPLEAVCLKAMTREPEGRYAAPRLLAEDIERWMADEPVTAYREPVSRRARRWAMRNRTAVATAAVALVAGVVGLAAVLVVQTQAKADIVRALASETRANVALADANAKVQARYNLAVEAISTFHTGVSEDFLLKEDKFKDLRERLLRSAVSFYEKLGALLKDEADLPSRRALLQANFEVAVLAGLVGRNEEALAMHRRVLAGREALAGDPAAVTGSRVDVARSLLSVGELLEATGLLAATGKGEAMTCYERARAVLAPDGATPADPAARVALAASEYRRGLLLQSQGKTAEGLATLEHARDLEDALADADRGNHDLQQERARTYSAIGYTLMDKDKREPEAALTAYKAALAIRQKLYDDKPAVTSFRSDLAMGHHNMGRLLLLTDKWSEAATEYRKALVINQKLVEDNSAVTTFRSDLAWSHHGLGEALWNLGKRPEAETEDRRALALLQKLTEENPRVTWFREGMFGVHRHLMFLLNRMRGPAEETAEGRKLVATFEKLAVDNPTVTELRETLAGSHEVLGQLLLYSGESLEAEVEFRQAIAHRQKLLDDNPTLAELRRNLASTLWYLGNLFSQAGRLSEAEAVHRKALAIRQKLADDNSGRFPSLLPGELADSLGSLGWLLAQAGKNNEAMDYYRREEEVRQKLLDATSSDVLVNLPNQLDYRVGYRTALANCQINSANFLRRVGKHAEARAACEQARSLLEPMVKANPENEFFRRTLAETYLRSGHVLSDSGDPAGATSAWRRAVTLYDSLRPLEPSQMLLRACCHAGLSALAGRPGSGVQAEEGPAEIDCAMNWLRQAVAAGYRNPYAYKTETALSPLRTFSNFRLLMMDLAMPADPFARGN
jgi:serine/threonine-protein kinase